MGSLIQEAPCARAAKRGGRKRRLTIYGAKTVILPNPEPVGPVGEEEVYPVKSVVVIRPSTASVASTWFDNGRMIQARMGLLGCEGLEVIYPIADGGEVGLFCFL